jgi:hypothetical protein
MAVDPEWPLFSEIVAAHQGFRDYSLLAKRVEQVHESGLKIPLKAHHRRWAVTKWQVVSKKFLNCTLVQSLNLSFVLIHPVCEMGMHAT